MNRIEVEVASKRSYANAGEWMIFGFGVIVLGAALIVLKVRSWDEINWFGFFVLLFVGMTMVVPKIRQLTIKKTDKEANE